MRYEHLVHRVPNWGVFHRLVSWLNARMLASGSRYKLEIRYRVPKRGHQYGTYGALKREHARRFSVYLRRRPPSGQQREIQRLQTNNFELRSTVRRLEKEIGDHREAMRKMLEKQARAEQAERARVAQELRRQGWEIDGDDGSRTMHEGDGRERHDPRNRD